MADITCGAVNIAAISFQSPASTLTLRAQCALTGQNSNYIHRPTAVIYMVAAGRFLVGRESLHKLPTLDLAIADFKVKLVADDF